jgi:TPR repeat protein
VANVVQIPSIGGGIPREDEVGRWQANAFGNLSKVAASYAKMQATDEPSVPPGTLPAAAPSSEILQPKSSALRPRAPAAFEPARPEIAAPTATAPPAPAASLEPRPSSSLSRDEITALLKRGRDLIAAGDIASARLILARVAEAGVAEASLVMAGTYDAVVLANVRVVGARPDTAKARAWYERAAQQGSWEAKQRLPTLR